VAAVGLRLIAHQQRGHATCGELLGGHRQQGKGIVAVIGHRAAPSARLGVVARQQFAAQRRGTHQVLSQQARGQWTVDGEILVGLVYQPRLHGHVGGHARTDREQGIDRLGERRRVGRGHQVTHGVGVLHVSLLLFGAVV
jgi:hypothetical protein